MAKAQPDECNETLTVYDPYDLVVDPDVSIDLSTLIDAEGNRCEVAKGDIEERKTLDVSPMPDNLADMLSPEEFADLIAYLASLRSSGQGSPGSGVVGPVALPVGFTRETVASRITGATAMDVAEEHRQHISRNFYDCPPAMHAG